MGFFKCLAYVGAGVGAVVLAPMTGGGSLALAIGAMGTTTAAGIAIGAGIGATAAAIDNGITSSKENYDRGFSQGKSAGENVASQKHEARMQDFMQRFKNYQDFDNKLVAMYALGLAVANADGNICEKEKEELDAFVAGCMAGYLPISLKDEISKLTNQPPTIENAVEFARKSNLPKNDIDDIIDIIANADDNYSSEEREFKNRWQQMSQFYEFS